MKSVWQNISYARIIEVLFRDKSNGKYTMKSEYTVSAISFHSSFNSKVSLTYTFGNQ